MSYYHLGIAHFPVLHRQFTSPTSERFPESPNEDLTQDSKDVLIDRLNDLVLRLSKVGSLKDRAISTIHSQVDKIEILVSRVETKNPSLPSRDGSLSVLREDDFWGPPTPTQSIKMRLPAISQNPPGNSILHEETVPDVSEASPTKAVEVADAAEALASKLSTVVAEFQIRKEECDRVHDLLVTRNERAAERILMLEYRIAEMEDDFQANQSELKFLRIQLQSIQAQCSNCIHRHEDPELDESIMNWKIDWEDINRRAKARRKKCDASLSHQLSDTSTVVDAT